MANLRQTVLWGLHAVAALVILVLGLSSGDDADGDAAARSPQWGFWLLLWPTLAYGSMAFAYTRPTADVGLWMLGKREDGSLPVLKTLFLLPYYVVVLVVWLVRHTLVLPHCMGEHPYDLVAPGVYVGRWPLRYPSEFPTDCKNVVDLTAEFPARKSVVSGRRYRCLASLDCDMPKPHDMLALAREVATWEGAVYVHCANGHGRSASLAALVMVLRGISPDWRAAFTKMQAARPLVHLQPPQERILDDLQARIGEAPPMALARGPNHSADVEMATARPRDV